MQTFPPPALNEISLLPVTGGMFTITLYTTTAASPQFQADVVETLLWDRKRDGGFPETKEFKNRVRNVVDPNRNMGHVDRALKKGQEKDDQKEGGEVVAVESAKVGDHKKDEAGKAYETLASHAEHKGREGPPKDCEECMEAAKVADASNERF